MAQVGFKSMIPVSKQLKIVTTLDCEGTMISWVIFFCFMYFIAENLHIWSSVSLISLLLLSHALTRKRRRISTWSRTSLIQYSSLFVLKRVTELLVSNLLTHCNEPSYRIFPLHIDSTPFLLVLIDLKVVLVFLYLLSVVFSWGGHVHLSVFASVINHPICCNINWGWSFTFHRSMLHHPICYPVMYIDLHFSIMFCDW